MEILGNPSWLWGSVAYRVDYDDPRGSRSDCGFGGPMLATDQAGDPLVWAATQTNLGIALWRLGERDSGTEKLEEAVAASS